MAEKKIKKEYYYYILVMTDEGPKFVTSLNMADKTCCWDELSVPRKFDPYIVDDFVLGLTINGNYALAVKMPYELTSQPYNYKKYTCKFVRKDGV